MKTIKIKTLHKIQEIPTEHLEHIDTEEAKFFKSFVKSAQFKFAWTYVRKRMPHEYVIITDTSVLEKIRETFKKHGLIIENMPFKKPELANSLHIIFEGFMYWLIEDCLNRRWIYGYVILGYNKFTYFPKEMQKDVYEPLVKKSEYEKLIGKT